MVTTEIRSRSEIATTLALAAATVGVFCGCYTGGITGALLFIRAQFQLSTSATEWIATFTGIGLIVGERSTTSTDRDRRKHREDFDQSLNQQHEVSLPADVAEDEGAGSR